ncbi:MAG: response regulator [Chitinophagales bacterium]|nr:response regulator [Chitinophagales bacterium]
METIAQPQIFCVEDDKMYQGLIENELVKKGYENISMFSSGKTFIDNLYKMPDIVFLDYSLEEEFTGIDLLRKVKSFNPDIQVIMLSGQENMEVAVNSLKYGAYDYVIKNDFAYRRISTLIGRICKWNTMLKRSKQLKRTERGIFLALGLVVAAAAVFSFMY